MSCRTIFSQEPTHQSSGTLFLMGKEENLKSATSANTDSLSREELKGAPSAKPRAILSAEKAVDIFRRSLVCDRSFSATSVGREYGISEKAVRDIWRARTWSDETRHLDPARLPRVSKLPGRPLGKRDSVPRRLKKNNHENSVRMKIQGPLKSSFSGHAPLQNITDADVGVSPALHRYVQSSNFSENADLSIDVHCCGGIDDGCDVDFQPFASCGLRQNVSSLPLTDPFPFAMEKSAPIEIGDHSCACASECVAERVQIGSRVPECKPSKGAGALSGTVRGGSWGPLVPTSWEPSDRNSKHTVLTTTSQSTSMTTAPPASMSANAKTGRSGGSSGGDGRGNALGECAARARFGLAGLAGASSESNLRKHEASVGNGWSDDVSRDDGGGAAGIWSGAHVELFCAPRNTQDQASGELALAFRAHFAPDLRHSCDMVQPVPSESAQRRCQWAYGFQDPHAADTTASACRGCAIDFGPGWPGSSPAGQLEDLPSSYARSTSQPVAAANARASAADTAGTDCTGQPQAPPQPPVHWLLVTARDGGARSTWQLEPEDWNPVFDPPPQRSAAEEARGLFPNLTLRHKGGREEVQDFAPQHQRCNPDHRHYHRYNHHEQHSHQHGNEDSHQHSNQHHHQHHQDLRNNWQQQHRQHQQLDPHHRYWPVQQDQQEPRQQPLQQYAMQQELHHDHHFQYQDDLYDPFLPRYGQLQEPHKHPNPKYDWQARQQDHDSSSLRMHGWG